MMDVQEAIEHLKEITGWANFWGGCYNDKLVAIDTAIEALEKQIPKKPMDAITSDNEFICMICSCCQVAVEFNDVYCKRCGQKLDWGEENE